MVFFEIVQSHGTRFGNGFGSDGRRSKRTRSPAHQRRVGAPQRREVIPDDSQSDRFGISGGLIELVFGLFLRRIEFLSRRPLRGIGFGAFSSVIYGMLADTVEYGEWKTGVRTQAINVTANGVGQKIGSGLGTAAFGGLLTMCGYNGMAEVQTASAVSCIRIIFIVAPIAIYLILIVLAWLFKLDKQFPQIQKELEERKRSKASVN